MTSYVLERPRTTKARIVRSQQKEPVAVNQPAIWRAVFKTDVPALAVDEMMLRFNANPSREYSICTTDILSPEIAARYEREVQDLGAAKAATSSGAPPVAG